MTCQILTFPNRAQNLADAREVLLSPDATDDQIVMAMTLLNASHDWQDVYLLRMLREADDLKARDVRARQAQAKAAQAEADRRDRALGWTLLAVAAVAVVVIVVFEKAVSAFVMGGM